MTVYVLLTIEDDQLLPRLISTMVETSVRFTVAKDLKNLFPHGDQLSTSAHLPSTAKPSTSQMDTNFRYVEELLPDRPLKVEYTDREEATQVEMEEDIEEEEEDYSQAGIDPNVLLFNSEPGPSADKEAEKRAEEIMKKFKDTMDEGMGELRKRKERNLNLRQCQVCSQWITAKNIRAHAGTHMSLHRLKCTGCTKRFSRMNRGLIHLKQIHENDPRIRIENAITPQTLRELDAMKLRCFPLSECICSTGDCRCDCK